MRSRRLAFVLCFLPMISTAADSVVGQRIFVKEDAEAWVGEVAIDQELIPSTAVVEEVDGDKLLVGRVWVRRSSVLSLPEALAFYNDQVRAEPAKASGWQRRSVVWSIKGDPVAALRDVNEAIRLDPDDPIGYMFRGNILVEKGELENAISDFTTALKLNPRALKAHFNRAFALATNGDFDNAISDLTEAIKLDPDDPISRNARGLVWQSKGDLSKAIEDFTQAIRSDGKYAIAYVNRGSARIMKGDFETAINDLEEAIRIDPKAVAAFTNIALVKSTCNDDRIRDGKVAVEYSVKACQLTEWKDWRAVNALAASYAEAGDFATAIRWQMKVLDIVPPREKRSAMFRLHLYRANTPCRDLQKNVANSPIGPA